MQFVVVKAFYMLTIICRLLSTDAGEPGVFCNITNKCPYTTFLPHGKVTARSRNSEAAVTWTIFPLLAWASTKIIPWLLYNLVLRQYITKNISKGVSCLITLYYSNYKFHVS